MKTVAVVVGGLILAAVSTGAGTVYLSNTFSTETPNSAWNTPNAGYAPNMAAAEVTGSGGYVLAGGMTKPVWAAANTAAGGRGAVVVPASGTTGFATQAVRLFSHSTFWGNGGADVGYVYVGRAPGVNAPLVGTTTGQYLFSFDLSIATNFDTSGWAEKPAMILETNWWASPTDPNPGYKTLVSFSNSNGNITLDSSSGAPGGALMTTTIVSGYALNTPYHFAAVLDMDSNTFTLAVNGAPVGGTFNQLFVNPLAFDRGIAGYYATGGKPTNNSSDGFFYSYDNIGLQSGPEPTTLALLGLSAAGLLLRRRCRSPRHA